ncbi:MAG: hypothetical protein GEU83_02375 [Pseudonocardiaceae bacterium]|nr:hypothetical protein [Pseudonocardiaceae bacterium]
MERIVVSVDDDHLDVLSDVVERMRGAGMVVDQVADAVGAVTGSIEPGALAALESVPGVAEVERQRGFQLPPPDSPIQ